MHPKNNIPIMRQAARGDWLGFWMEDEIDYVVTTRISDTLWRLENEDGSRQMLAFGDELYQALAAQLIFRVETLERAINTALGEGIPTDPDEYPECNRAVGHLCVAINPSTYPTFADWMASWDRDENGHPLEHNDE